MTTIRPNSAVGHLLLAIALGACAETDAAPLPAEAPLSEMIAQETLEADVHALAHDSTAGRAVDTPELEEATDWIAARFATAGLEPAGDNGTFDQNFDLVWASLGQGSRLSVGGEAGAREPGQGWYPLTISASDSASSDVVFAGFGIEEPRLQYDDYQGADVQGKIVLVLEREPGVDDPASPFDGVVTSEASRDWRKALTAQKRGAVGILFVRDVHKRPEIEDWNEATASYWPPERRRIERYALRERIEDVTIPAALISADLAETLVAGSGQTLQQLATAAEAASRGLGVRELPGAQVSLTTAVERNVVPGRNLLAMIEGSDPELADEVVILTGHHDHNGADGEDIFNGADDNASGAIGVLAVAEAYARAAEQGLRPRRTVLFAIADAEERGLLGAWYYTRHPTFPLDNTVAVLNLDMIGRNEEVPPDGGARFNGLPTQTAESNANAINIIGTRRAPELGALIEAANEQTALTLRFRYDNNESNLMRRSDHWPFIQNGVPGVWFHSGLHPDYHTPNDVAERINYEKMTRIVRLAYEASWDLANADGRPTLEPMGSRPAS